MSHVNLRIFFCPGSINFLAPPLTGSSIMSWWEDCPLARGQVLFGVIHEETSFFLEDKNIPDQLKRSCWNKMCLTLSFEF